MPNEWIEQPPPRRASSDYSGPATLEAYTVPYARDGEPEAAIVSAITPEGMRALTRSTDEEQIQTLLETDPLGRRISALAELLDRARAAWRTRWSRSATFVARWAASA